MNSEEQVFLDTLLTSDKTDTEMYGKIFKQIFASSVAQDYKVRHLFMDLIVLADPDGTVDMTVESISGVTRVPSDEVRVIIDILEKPDPQSRSQEKDGARLERLDTHRNWGWRIINYEKYRKIASEEQRKEAQRLRMKKSRGSEVEFTEVIDSTMNTINAHKSAQMRTAIPLLLPVQEGGTGGSKTRPNLEAVIAFCNKSNIHASDAEWFFYKCDGNGWLNGGKPIKSWTSTLLSWQRAGYLPSQKQGTHSGNATEKIVWQKEYERLEARLQTLNSTYSGHQAWDSRDREEKKKLLARKAELKTLLGILI